MEEDSLLAQLASDNSQELEKALLSLHEKLAKNNGILVLKNLSKLK